MPDYLTGDDLEEVDKEACDQLIEDMEEEQKAWLEGDIGLPGRRRNTASRYAFYQSVTLITERMYVLDPDYREKAAMGIYPPLADVLWYVIDPEGKPLSEPLPSQEVAMYYAQSMGLLKPEMFPQQQMGPDGMPMMVPPTLPPPVGSRPNYWGMILDLGEFPSGWSMFRAKSRDYKNCIEAAGRQVEKTEAVA